MERKALGDRGEQVALEYLRSKGYKILRSNYRNRLGEIDLIVENNDFLVFIEVKTRKTTSYGLASEAVGVRKQRKIINASKIYIMNIYSDGIYKKQVRYDIIEIYALNDKYKINHIENAFIY